MAIPIKRISDAPTSFLSSTAADVDPHLSAPSTGGLTIVFDVPSASDVNAAFTWIAADAFISATFFPSSSGTTRETGSGSYGLASGNVVMVWFMGGGHMIADINIGNLTGYSLLGVGDFNGDHTSDLVWRNNMSNVTETWLMQQGARVGGSTLGNLAGYQLLETGDLNHDGTDDLVWRASTGATSSWAMHDGQFHNDEQFLGGLGGFAIGGFGDFTGDGGKDVLLLNTFGNQTFADDIEHHSLTASDFLIS